MSFIYKLTLPHFEELLMGRVQRDKNMGREAESSFQKRCRGGSLLPLFTQEISEAGKVEILILIYSWKEIYTQSSCILAHKNILTGKRVCEASKPIFLTPASQVFPHPQMVSVGLAFTLKLHWPWTVILSIWAQAEWRARHTCLGSPPPLAAVQRTLPDARPTLGMIYPETKHRSIHYLEKLPEDKRSSVPRRCGCSTWTA